MSQQDSGARIGLVLMALLVGLLVAGLMAWTQVSHQKQVQDELDQKTKETELRAAEGRAREKARSESQDASFSESNAAAASMPMLEPDAAPNDGNKPQAEEPEPAKGGQRAFVLMQGWTNNLSDLNALLKKGWRIKQTCVMSAAANDRTSYSLVVLEKEF